VQGYSRVILVGHSYGCYLVNRLASEAHAGEKVAGVVLIGAGYPVPGYERLRWIFYFPLFVSASAPALLSVAQLCLVTACIQGRSGAEQMCEQWLVCNMGYSALLDLCRNHKSGDFKHAIIRGQ
jgi:pimeloyl-ACP methyl ester carboxylesterase